MGRFAARTPLLALLAVTAALLLPAWAVGDDAPPPDTAVAFSLGKLVRATPDARARIGVRVNCLETSGCNLKLALVRQGTPPSQLGVVYGLLIGGSTETDYLILTRTAQKLLVRKKTLPATFIAEVTDPAGNKATFMKNMTLRAPKKKSARR